MPDRLELHKRIENVLKLCGKRILNEVKGLMGKYDFDENLPSMRSVGYRQAIEFLKKVT